MKTLILGGDGFCGWPTSLHLSSKGHEIVIVDNLSRRSIDIELEVESLTPIRPIGERLRTWKAVSGKEVNFVNLDLALQYNKLLTLLKDFQPDAVVHFAEQRAAPYSMRSPRTKRYTVDNNVRGTHNLLCALVEAGLESTAVVHLGTMGVYGYGWSGTAPIPEGYLAVKVPTPEGELVREILHPANPGSVYHMTKTLDQLLFAFYAKNDGVRITDLHQGIVWGTQTDQTILDERLVNRFDYDGDYGTVLNRFLMQAAIGHPLTVHGTGGQTRAFIHIRDTVRCIEIAIDNPPAPGERVSVFNQTTEVYRVRDLASLVSKLTGAEMVMLPNPRQEAAENELVVQNDRFLALGLNPTTLSDGLLEEVRLIASKYRHRVDPSKIVARSVWRKGMEVAPDLQVSVPADDVGGSGPAMANSPDELINGPAHLRETGV
jgi:UDP-sulfoquinovose synthase